MTMENNNKGTTGRNNAFDRIVGYDGIKNELYRICDILRHPDKYRKMGAVPSRGLLLYGSPGVGKTEMAKCLLAESGRKSFIIRKDRADGDFIDKIRNVFNEAKAAAPSIILLDDMDNFEESDKQEAFTTIQACIDGCTDYEIFVIATVKTSRNIPYALRRPGRIGTELHICRPNKKDILKIAEYYLKGKHLASDIDYEEVARLIEGCSCAMLASILNSAAIYACYRGVDCIERQDFLMACVSRHCDSPIVWEAGSNKKLEAVAIHEAGHAVVAEILNPGSVNFVYAFINDNEKEGAVKCTSNEMEDNWDDDVNDIIISLGAKAASEIIKGVPDGGCARDLSYVFDMSERLLDVYCPLGFNSYSHGIEPSQDVRSARDRMISTEVTRCYQKAKKILIDNRAFLEAMIVALKSKNILTYKEIAEIKENVGMQ